MVNVSQAYQESMKNIVRNQSYEQITLNIFNVEAMDDVTVTVTDRDTALCGSDWLSHIPDGEAVASATAYSTLEPYRFVLDGTQEPIEASTASMEGYPYVSSTLSDANGEWATPPTLTIAFGQNYGFSGLTFIGDVSTGDYVSKLTVACYTYAGVLMQTYTVEPTSVQYVWRKNLDGVGKMIISCLKSSTPYRRARFYKIHLGLSKVFDNRVISKTVETNEVDPLSRRLPTEKFTAKIYDLEREFDPDKDSSLWEYIAENQTLVDTKGYELDDGTVEWLTPTYYTLSGTPTWSGWTISFSAERTLSQLDGTYQKSVVPSSPVTLGSLAEAVLTDALGDDATQWSIDESLYDVTTSSPLPVASYRECLQIIAQAGNCRLYTNRGGVVILSKGWYPTEVQGLNIDLNAQKSYPTVEVIPPLAVENILLYDNSIASESTSVLNTEMVVNGTETVWVDYQCTANPVAAVTGGTLNSSQMFAYGCFLNITATGTVTIDVTGNVVTQTSASRPVTVQANITGSTDDVDNVLVTNLACKEEFEQNRAKYLKNRTSYTLKYRGNPEVDCGDAIMFETLYEKNAIGVVLSNKIEFNGSLSGTMVVKRLDSYKNAIYAGELYAGETLGVM